MLTEHNVLTDGETRVVSSRIGRLSYATPPKMRWSCVEGTLFVLNGVDVKPSAKIASFDMVRCRGHYHPLLIASLT